MHTEPIAQAHWAGGCGPASLGQGPRTLQLDPPSPSRSPALQPRTDAAGPRPVEKQLLRKRRQGELCRGGGLA